MAIESLQKVRGAVGSGERKVLNRVLERYDDSLVFDLPFKEDALNNWKAYNSVLPTPWPFWGDTYESETQLAVNEAVEKIMQTLFAKDNFFDLEPLDSQSEIQTELMREKMAGLLKSRDVRYKLHEYGRMQEAITFGNGVMWVGVHPKVRQTFFHEQEFNEFGVAESFQQKDRTRIDWLPKLKPISRFNCFPAPTGSTIQEMPYFIHTEWVPLEWIKSRKWLGWKHLEDLEGVDLFAEGSQRFRGNNTTDESQFELFERLRLAGYDVFTGARREFGKKPVNFVELMWYTESNPDQEGAHKITVVGNRAFVLSDGINPFWHGKKPYSELKWGRLESGLWQALGIPTLIEHFQRKLNIRSAQVNDLIELRRAPGWMVGDNAGVEDLSDLDPWPNAQIRMTGDINQLKQLAGPQVGQELFSDLDLTRSSIQRTTRLFDASRGTFGRRTGIGEGANTATGLSIINDIQQQSTAFKLLFAEETGVVETLEIIASNIQQTITDPEPLRISSSNETLIKNGMTGVVILSPRDIQGQWNFIAIGASKAQEDEETLQAMAVWIKEWAQDPEVGPRLKKLELALETGELMFRSPGRFIKSDEEMLQDLLQQGQQQLPEELQTDVLPPQQPAPQPVSVNVDTDDDKRAKKYTFVRDEFGRVTGLIEEPLSEQPVRAIQFQRDPSGQLIGAGVVNQEPQANAV